MYIQWKKRTYKNPDRGTYYAAYLVRSIRCQNGEVRYPIRAKLGNLPTKTNVGYRRDFVQLATNRINNVFHDVRDIGCKLEDRDSLRDRLVTDLSEKVGQFMALV